MSIWKMDKVLLETGFRSRSTMHAAVREGLFTNQVAVGDGSVGWPDYEVTAIIQARIAGFSDEQIKALVVRLNDRRISNYREDL